MKYYLTEPGRPEREVTKEEYVNCESRCGFHSKFGLGEIATASFSHWVPEGATWRGRVEYDKPTVQR